MRRVRCLLHRPVCGHEARQGDCAGNDFVEDQSFHTLRHVTGGGYDVTVVQNAIVGNLSNIGASLPDGLYNGTVVVSGMTFNYSAYKLLNGTINVSRITPPK